MYVAFKDHRVGTCSLDDPETRTTTHTTAPGSKWLSGDIVNLTTGKVIERRFSTHRAIVGIVDFLNRTRCGFTPRGVPLYYFHPLDASYPTMVVASKIAPTTNQFAVVALEHWDDMWPRAGIHTLLGEVGDKRVEKRALLAKFASPKRGALGEVVLPDVSSILKYDTVINIDPSGCEDVDDVFCWKRIDDGYEFAIAIADVAEWVGEKTDIDILAFQKGETVYVDGAVVEPMLPTELSTLRASLRRDGMPRPVIGLVYTIRDGAVESMEWKAMNVVVTTAHTYDSVYADTDICRILCYCLSTITGQELTSDSHKWVESAMITYNTEAAKLLRKHNVGILRSHKGKSNTEWLTLADKTGCAELAHMGTAKGTYVYATAEDTAHNGLGLPLYCHASSPLRRYADLVNQRYMKYILSGTHEPVAIPLPSHLNARSRIVKSLERDMWFLRNLNTDAITEQTGFLIQFKETCNTWTVYVPVWRRTVKAKYNGADELVSGMSVTVQAYTNLAAVSWSNRIVCTIASRQQ
jgi:exoribonuclease R